MRFTVPLLLSIPLASSNLLYGRADESCAVATSEGSCQQARQCAALETTFPGRLHYKAADTNFTIWDQKQQQTVYVCRVLPTSAAEVSQILQVLVQNWCRFAVKCGGHSRFPDDSVSVGGVTIDLGLMSSTVVSEDRTSALVGGGALTRQIFAALDPYGLAHIGGRQGQVGIGGFALGGGTSVLSAKHGWALDSILEYEVVLPNATIITVSETQHPDLYWALRGGGNNFGIVTAFNVTVFPQGPVWVGSRAFTDEHAEQVLEEAEKIFTLEDAEDTNIVLEYRYSFSTAQNSGTITTTQRYIEPVSRPSVYNALNAIPAVANLTGTISSLANSTGNTPVLGQSRAIFASLTHYPSVSLGKQAIELLKEEMQLLGNSTGISSTLITYSIPTTAIKRMKSRGGNALGIDVEGHLIINLLSVTWPSNAEDRAAHALVSRFMTNFKAAAEKLDVLHPFVYINYANKGDDVFAGYGETNKQRLIAIQKSVDPFGIFTSSGLWRGFFKVR
ncbi:FAD binding domain protein [Leptodontidium sp. 2 PMI_412]|nr:FAD binding domain protein [Leptodontidium sp. 2 PMI_412]